MNKIYLLSLFLILMNESSFSQNNLGFSVASFNKNVNSDTDLVFILKIQNNSNQEEYIPETYQFSLKDCRYANVEYEIIYCSDDTANYYKEGCPLVCTFGEDTYRRDTSRIKLMPNMEFLFKAKNINSQNFCAIGIYKIKFRFVNETYWYSTIPGLETDWIYFTVLKRICSVPNRNTKSQNGKSLRPDK